MNSTVRDHEEAFADTQGNEEMGVAAALVHFGQVLHGIGNRSDDKSTVTVPASLMREMAAFMHDYRRHLEVSYASLGFMHFKSIAERNKSLDAYQWVCQRATAVLLSVEAAAE